MKKQVLSTVLVGLSVLFGLSSQTAASAQSQSVPSLPVPFVQFHMVSATVGWAVGQGDIWYTTNGAEAWRNVGPPHLMNPKINSGPYFYSVGANDAWACVENGSGSVLRIYHTINAGKKWAETTIPDITFVINMEFKNQNDGWMATNLGLTAGGSEQESVYHTKNGGTTWTKIASSPMKSTPNTLSIGGNKSGVGFASNQRGWATGTTYVFGHSYLYETRNGGRTWQPQELSIPHGLKGAQIATYPPKFFTSKVGLLPVQAVVQPSNRSQLIVYRTTNAGNLWRPTAPLRGVPNVWVLESSHWWAALVNGKRLNVTVNGGRNWHTVRPNIQASNITELEFTSANQGWALMNSGLLYETKDGGSHWRRAASVKL